MKYQNLLESHKTPCSPEGVGDDQYGKFLTKPPGLEGREMTKLQCYSLVINTRIIAYGVGKLP